MKIMKKFKVYLLYKKGHRLLYAYTPEKKLLDEFLSQRNPECFNLEIVKMRFEEYSKFSDNYITKVLSSQPFTTYMNGKTHTVYMVVTSGELSAIENRCDELLMDMTKTFTFLALTHYFGGKISQAVSYLTAVTVDNPLPTGGIIKNASVDDLKILYDLYKDTFVRCEKVDFV